MNNVCLEENHNVMKSPKRVVMVRRIYSSDGQMASHVIGEI